MTYDELIDLINRGAFDKLHAILTANPKTTDVAKLKAEWDSATHRISDTALRPNRSVNVDERDEEGNPTGQLRPVTVEVSRIAVPFQKRITNTAVSFIFGNPVSVTAPTAENDNQKNLIDYINRILRANKTDSVNRLLARSLFRSTQIFEVWHFAEQKETHSTYGFDTKYDIRLSTFSSWDGSKLYPYYGPHGDLIAFCREYVVMAEDLETLDVTAAREVTYFEIYTKDLVYLWKSDSINPTWVQANDPTKTLIDAIPGVYGEQELAEWEDVQNAIERLETLLSNHADVNDYNGSPILVASGGVLSMSQKGEAGKLLEVKEGGDLKYLSWDAAPASIKLEIENLFDLLYTFTQTPRFNSEAMKGINTISGVALKLLFMDAHLKVMDKREIFDPYLTRRVNVIKKILGYILGKSFKADLEKLEVKIDIKPYMIEDLKELIGTLIQANGMKAVASQKTTVALSGLTTDPDAEFEQIQKEEADAAEAQAALLLNASEPNA